jgi:predicted nucleic acid-binding protein
VLAVVDAGALVAVADARDPNREAVTEVLVRPDLILTVPAMVIAEATYFIAERFGPVAEANFLASLTRFEIEAPLREDWLRISELVYQYRDFPLGGTDASVVVLAERLNTDLIITLDRRHFSAMRPRHVPSFRLLPE